MSASNANGVVSTASIGGVIGGDVGANTGGGSKPTASDPFAGSVPEITAVQGIVPTLQSV